MEWLRQMNELREHLDNVPVLSVYIAPMDSDPAQRRAWRKRLDAGIAYASRHLDAGSADAFKLACKEVLAQVRGRHGFPGDRGHAVFATAHGVVAELQLPAATSDVVRWRRGALLGPLLRSLRHDQALVAVLSDSRRVRLLRWQHGELAEQVDFRADDYIDDLTDRNMSKRAARSSGVRGETAKDAAQRILRQESAHLLEHVAGVISAEDAALPVIVGGPATAAGALHRMLLDRGVRAQVEPGLHVLMSLQELRAAVEPIAAELAHAAQLAVVRAMQELSGADERAVWGDTDSADAAARRQSDLLLLTPRFLDEHEEPAEELIARILDGGGAVAVVSGEAERVLDEEGGVAARLRYVRKEPVAGAATAV